MSDKPKVLVRDWESGDWIQVLVNGELVEENHSLCTSDWVEVLRRCGIEVTQEDVPDEEEDD